MVGNKKAYMKVKRVFDFLFAIVMLIVCLPIFLCIMLLIKFDSKGAVFFRQRRIGKDKKIFYILKFRTMSIETPKNMPTHQLEHPEKYITRIGYFLRKTSLDELPQLINILRGDMSFIGPRPALWNQFDLILERDKYGANDIPPGLTGWAQINGRDELDIKTKAKYDGIYVKYRGLLMDLACVIGTILTVLKQDGIVEGKL